MDHVQDALTIQGHQVAMVRKATANKIPVRLILWFKKMDLIKGHVKIAQITQLPELIKDSV